MVAPPNSLHHAILAQDNAQVKALLEGGVNPDTTQDMHPPLMAAGHTTSAINVAIISENDEALALLLDHGASVNHGEPQPPVMAAVASKRLSALRLLQTKGAWLEEAHLGEDGGTLLHMASNLGDHATVQWLLTQGLDPNATDHYQFTPLLCACSGEMHSGHVQAALALLAAGANPQCVEPDFIPQGSLEPRPQPLGLAIDKGQTNLVKALLAAGANPDAAYSVRKGFSKPRSALASAIWGEMTTHEITSTLIGAGAELSGMVEYDFRSGAIVDHAEIDDPLKWRDGADSLDLLQLAAACDRYREVAMLHEAGFAIDKPTRQGHTALHAFLRSAARDPTPDVERTLATLLELGADPNAPTPNGETPLMLLAKRYNSLPGSERKTLAMMQTLLNAGADPATQNGNGMTALDVLLTASEATCAGARLLTAHIDHQALEATTGTPAPPRHGRRL